MWNKIKPEKILFLDIETVPLSPAYDQLNESMKKFWDRKARYIMKEGQNPADVYDRAGIYAEFGKVICISFGLFYEKNGQRYARLKSLASENEKEILADFAELLQKFYEPGNTYLCAHNGKEFDFPFMARRMLINGVKIPEILNVSGFKPWETPFLDTLEFWKFGDYKHYTSLNLLAYLFGIPSPKADIDGSMVAKVYWEDHNLERISKYCKNDVLTIMQLFLKFRGEPLLETPTIEIV
jgi:DNA polymerase elongation subunit (family B)